MIAMSENETDSSPLATLHPVSDVIPESQDFDQPRMWSSKKIDEPRRWVCEYHDFETEDEALKTWHCRQTHPVWCSHGVAPSRTTMAAYTYFDGRWSRPLCAEHAASLWKRSNGTFRERVERESRPANAGAEGLPTDHPIERKIAEVDDDE